MSIRGASAEKTIVSHWTSLGGETLPLSIDFSRRREIKNGGQQLVSASISVLLDDAVSTDFVVANISLDSTGTKVNFKLINVSATAPKTYRLICTVQLSGGAILVEGLDIEIEVPPGTMKVACS